MTALEGSDYEVIRTLGAGGMGRVYEARARKTGESVAIKTLMRSGDAGARRMLLSEATIAAQLEHDNVVRLLDVGGDGEGNLFLVMELVVGFDLDQWLAVFPGGRVVLDALAQVADGLAVAHGGGIVHGDLKPANVLVERATGRAKITDFGIAHVIDPLATQTPNHRFAGTPYYMAPEQYFGDDALGPWTDLYALGVMLFELLSGIPPFSGNNVVDLFRKKIVGVPPFDPRTGVHGSPELDALVRALLDPIPRRRPRFAAEVAERIRAIAAAMPRASFSEAGAPPSKRPTSVVPEVGYAETQMAVGQTELAPASATPRKPESSPKTEAMTHPSNIERSRSDTSPLFLRPGERTEGLSLDGRRAIPFVGRKREIQLFEDLVARVAEERIPRTLVLLGGAGVGKSRLARHGLSHVERTGTMDGAAAAFDVSETTVAGGLRHAFRRLLGFPTRPSSDVRAAWTWLESDAGKLPFDAVRMEAWLARADPMTERDIVDLAMSGLEACAARRPIYLWFDDAGWSRDGTLALIEAILERENLPVLCALTLRTGTADHPALRERLGRLAQNERVRFEHLGLLAEAERRTLLERTAPLAPELLDALASIDETPLLLVQTLRDWIESGTLELDDGIYRPSLGRPVSYLLATRSPARVFAQRLDALVAAFATSAAAAAARILFRMALLGARFRPETLAFCLGDDAGAIDEVLDRAMLAGIVRLDRDALRFDHGLFQEALMEKLASHPDAAALRRDVARGLLHAYGAERADIQARAATLYREAGDHDEAARTLAIAVRATLRAGAFDTASVHLATIERWAKEDDVPAVHARIGALHRMRGLQHYFQLRYEEARAEYERAATIYEALGDVHGLRDVRFNVSSTYFYQDRFRETEAIARAIVDEPVDESDDGVAHILTMAHHRLSDLAGLRGDSKAMLHPADEAARYGARSEPWVRPFTRVARAECAIVQGDVDHAVRVAGELARSVEESGDNAVSNDLLELRLKIDLARGQWRGARAAIELRLAAVLAQDDRWRRTMLLLFNALCSAAIDSATETRRAVAAFVASWDEVHHDEAVSWWAIARMIELLDERDEDELAELVRQRMATRKEQIARAFT
ncbi:hypothetical protein BH09MYX1_BH09MYX1_54760 [soil metagenome]